MSEILHNKIDFMFIIHCDKCNPNGDPINHNFPRINHNDLGEISDVCIKRKIRNRFADMGHEILYATGRNNCLKDKTLELSKDIKGSDAFYKECCDKWIDARAFGAVLPIKGNDLSMGLRGCVSIMTPETIEELHTEVRMHTKSMNVVERDLDKPDNMSMYQKSLVHNAVYVGYGGISVQLAEKTGFTQEDAETLKEAISTLFVGDESTTRPAGSMTMCELRWWTHNNKNGQYSPAKIHHSLTVQPTSIFPFYDVKENYKLADIKCDIYNFVK